MSQTASNKNSQPQTPDALTGNVAGIDTEFAAVGANDAPRFVAPTHGGVDILKLLSELEDLVDKTRRGPGGLMFGFKEDQFHMTVMKIRANLPEEMKRASKLARDSERIVEETQAHADRVMDDAREQAVRLRSDAQSEMERARRSGEESAGQILAQARREADELVAEAREQAAQMVSDCDIVQAAQVEAQEVVARARRDAEETARAAHEEADGVRRGADDYARDLLGNLEGVLGKAIHQVQRGRELLESR